MGGLERFGRMADKLNARETLENLGVAAFFRRFAYSGDIKKSKQLFRDNKDQISKVKEAFSDDESRRVYEALLKYRSTFDKRWLKNICSTENQYFIKPIVDMVSKGGVTFVDCGAFIGDTTEVFLRYCSNKYERVYAFEPDKENYYKLKKTCNSEKMVLYNTGVWNEDTDLVFSCGHGSSSRMDESSMKKGTPDSVPSDERVVVPVKKLDGLIEGDRIFVKMDIEGSETRALLGAEELIEKKRPILAICIYHSDEDMVVIPDWIVEHCGKEYDYYCRHYTECTDETVFYAVPR